MFSRWPELSSEAHRKHLLPIMVYCIASSFSSFRWCPPLWRTNYKILLRLLHRGRERMKMKENNENDTPTNQPTNQPNSHHHYHQPKAKTRRTITCGQAKMSEFGLLHFIRFLVSPRNFRAFHWSATREVAKRKAVKRHQDAKGETQSVLTSISLYLSFHFNSYPVMDTARMRGK